MALRDLLWWDGAQRSAPPVTDAYLPDGGIARLVSATADGAPVTLAIQASHNGVNHNHNDVGGFVLHIGGENLLTHPGRGLYTRQFRPGALRQHLRQLLRPQRPAHRRRVASRRSRVSGQVPGCRVGGANQARRN